MTAEENKALVERYFEQVVNHRNLGLIDQLVKADGGGTCGGLSRFQGRDGFKQNTQEVLQAFPDFHLDIDDLVAEGDTVAIRWTGRGTHQGEFMGIPATSRVVPMTNVEIFRIEDGQIASIYAQPDLMTMMQAFNVLPAAFQASMKFLTAPPDGGGDRPAGGPVNPPPVTTPTTRTNPGRGAPAAAQGGWFTCEVLRVGPAEDGEVYLALKDNSNSWPDWRWYSAVQACRKEMLATALTAVSMQLPVTVFLTTTDEYGEVDRLYVTRD